MRMQGDGPTYSYSRITTFEQCPRRFRYRYLDSVKEAFRSVEGFMGQQVHAAIEWLFEQRAAGVKPLCEQAVAYYCDSWDRSMMTGQAPVRVIRRGEEMESYRRLGAELLARFHRDRFLTDNLETLANEKHFLVQVAGRYRFQGFIDRLARGKDGMVHLIDYKTGRRVPARFEGKAAQQLEVYALAMFSQMAVDELNLVLEFLRAGTRLVRRIHRKDAARVEQELAGRIEVTTESTVFPPHPGILCEWCGYNDLCEAHASRSQSDGRSWLSRRAFTNNPV